MAREDLICIAEEFSEWLEYISERYQADKNDVQAIIKQFLM